MTMILWFAAFAGVGAMHAHLTGKPKSGPADRAAALVLVAVAFFVMGATAVIVR